MPKVIFVKRAHPGGSSSRRYEAYIELEVPHLLTHRGARYQLEGVGEFAVDEAHVTADGVILYEDIEDLGDPDEPRHVPWMNDLTSKGWHGDLTRRRVHFRPISTLMPPSAETPPAAHPPLHLVDPDDES